MLVAHQTILVHGAGFRGSFPGRTPAAYSGAMSEHEANLIDAFRAALGLSQTGEARCHGLGTLTSAFAVSEMATAAFVAVGLAASELIEATSDAAAPVSVDRALASAWYRAALTPTGWQPPSPWDPLAGDYLTGDGWIRLHTNAPRHRAAALAVLEVAVLEVAVDGDDSVADSSRADSIGIARDAVAAAVAGWPGEELEAAIVAAGGCAAVMRSAQEWSRHPQGSRVSTEPLVGWSAGQPGRASERWVPSAEHPLRGLRVLDLTRVIAGPVATRLLAGLGADVLRVDPPDWDEPAVVPDMTLGKRCARVDATTVEGLETLEGLIAGADVLVHGYRPGALHRLVPAERRAELRPGLVEVSLDAYGWSGPWHERRGFDSLVQMSSGIAEAGMGWAASLGETAERPTPLPVQALDHTTGYLAAAAVLRALTLLVRDGVASTARVSLARVAGELLGTGPTAGAAERGLLFTTVETPWGAAQLLDAPVSIGAARFTWSPPRALGSDTARW
jgi:crotonobetainyl-CoA:carnitine CoA-transferase CaiB-like acyl-CoA transferase